MPDPPVRPRAPARRPFLFSLAPGKVEHGVALAVVVLLGLAFLVALPLARLPAGRIPPFVPAYEAALFICDLLTAALLIGQFLRRAPWRCWCWVPATYSTR